jgi:hypothetical protein
MSHQLIALAYRRKKLVQKISEQRTDVAELIQQWQKPIALVDSGLQVFQILRSHRALIAGTVTTLLAWRMQGLVGLAKSGWRLIYLYPSAIFAGYKYFTAQKTCLAEQNITTPICKKGARGHPLTKAQKAANHEQSTVS